MTIAALYVDTVAGPYVGRRDVELHGWASKDGRQHDLLAPTRDAMDYDGPWPVVAHPPCGPWGRFRTRYLGGEGDARCGPRAVEQVRAHGGVLEHPAYSTLWAATGMPMPADGLDEWGGYTVQANQVDWGHPCLKPTWFYVVGVDRRDLPAMPGPGTPTHCMVRLHRNPHELPELSKRLRHLTPPALAEWLVALARSARRREAA
jgi:hypothetical protein